MSAMARGQPFGGYRRGGSEKVRIGTLVAGVASKDVELNIWLLCVLPRVDA